MRGGGASHYPLGALVMDWSMALLASIPSVAHIVLPHVLDEVDLLEALWSR